MRARASALPEIACKIPYDVSMHTLDWKAYTVWPLNEEHA